MAFDTDLTDDENPEAIVAGRTPGTVTFECVGCGREMKVTLSAANQLHRDGETLGCVGPDHSPITMAIPEPPYEYPDN